MLVEDVRFLLGMSVSRVYADAVTSRPSEYSDYLDYSVKYG